MGAKDTVTIKYLRQNKIFADAFNYLIYDGEQIIDPNSLEELDARELDVPYGGENGAEQPVQRTRDVIKSVTAMTDRRTAYLVLAIESQSNIHYAMPVKNMVYDALQYAKQIEKAIASHKKSGDYKGADSDEYMSGFMKNDRLMPVVTLVMYFDSKAWDGPMSVHEMFSTKDAKILSLVPDYKLNLIAPAAIPDEDFDKFSSTLKEVLAFIKYSRDADKLDDLLETDREFRKLGRQEVDVLNSCVNANLAMNENEEVLDVCEAIQVLNQRAADRAAKEATLKATANTTSAVAKRMLQGGELSVEKISEYLGMSIEDVKALAKELRS